MAKKKKSSRRSNGGGGIATKLREMGRGWKDTVARTGGAGFPAGRGQEAVIRSIVIEESQKGNLQVTWTLEGLSEGIEKVKDWKRSMLMTAENREWLRGEMETIGLTWPDSIDDLGDALGEAEGREVSIDVVDRDEFHNIYFRSALETGNGGDDNGVGEDDDQYTKADIKKLGKDADKDDDDAIDELTDLAKESKIDPNDYDTWAELADEIIEDLGL